MADTGYTALPFPNNALQPGEVVAIFTKPKKVEPVFKMVTSGKAIESPGWNVDSTETEKIETKLSANITKVAKASGEFSRDSKIEVKLTNTRTVSKRGVDLLRALASSYQKNSDLKRYLDWYSAKPYTRRFDVITSVIIADIVATKTNSKGEKIELSTEEIAKINTSVEGEFERERSSKATVTGKNLVVGYHRDPDMVPLVLERMNPSTETR